MSYGQSVYAVLPPGVADQDAAMPSIHVGWALLIGLAVWSCSRSRWRWIGPVHAVATCLIVVWTANHYWVDGVAAAALLGVAWLAARQLERWLAPPAALAESIEPIALPADAASGRMVV
jgi:hypothetical protein